MHKVATTYKIATTLCVWLYSLLCCSYSIKWRRYLCLTGLVHTKKEIVVIY